VDIFEIYTRVEKHVKQALLTYGIHMPRWKFWPLTVRIPKRTCAHVKSNVRSLHLADMPGHWGKADIARDLRAATRESQKNAGATAARP
jgi:hypothetical protein